MVLFNPQDPQFVANPYPVYQKMRQESPLYYRKEKNDWILTRYDDIKFALTDKRFEFPEIPCRKNELSVWQHLFASELDPQTFFQLRKKCEELTSLWIVNQGHSRHTQIKRIMTNSFVPKCIDAIRSEIQNIAHTLIDKIRLKTTIDIVKELAMPLPVMVICKIFQVPHEEILFHFPGWARDITAGMEIDRTPLMKEKATMATMAFSKHLSNLIQKRQENVQNDPLSDLIVAYKQKQLDGDDLLANTLLLFFGGVETAQRAIGKGILTLLNNPQQKSLLQQQPDLATSTVEECLRYESPNQFTVRMANEDVEIDGKTIRKNQKLRLFLAAANRDPKVFTYPEQFDITRNPNPHLAFGSGRHFCLGAYLARTEIQIAIEEIIKHFPKITLNKENPPVWEMGLRIHGLKSLVVNL